MTLHLNCAMCTVHTKWFNCSGINSICSASEWEIVHCFQIKFILIKWTNVWRRKMLQITCCSIHFTQTFTRVIPFYLFFKNDLSSKFDWIFNYPTIKTKMSNLILIRYNLYWKELKITIFDMNGTYFVAIDGLAYKMKGDTIKSGILF